MKRTMTIILLLLPLFLSAQDVWREGTEWINYFEDSSKVSYKLSGKTDIEGTEYLNLFMEEENNSTLLAYVRAEQGDTVVYIRALFQQEVYEEELLYDFGTFEPGTIIRYGIMGIPIKELVVLEEDLFYYHDVLSEGDVLPCFKGILFKIGYLGNPIYLYQHPFEKIHPKTKNISHIVLKLNGRDIQLSAPASNFINSVNIHPSSLKCFDVQGFPSTLPPKGIYIREGKKYIRKK